MEIGDKILINQSNWMQYWKQYLLTRKEKWQRSKVLYALLIVVADFIRITGLKGPLKLSS